MLHRSSKTYMGLSGDLEERNNMLMIYHFAYSKKTIHFQTHPHHGQIPQKTVGRAEYESTVTSFRTRMVWWILKKEPKSACLKRGQLSPLGASFAASQANPRPAKAAAGIESKILMQTTSSCHHKIRHTHPKIHLFRQIIKF